MHRAGVIPPFPLLPAEPRFRHRDTRKNPTSHSRTDYTVGKVSTDGQFLGTPGIHVLKSVSTLGGYTERRPNGWPFINLHPGVHTNSQTLLERTAGTPTVPSGRGYYLQTARARASVWNRSRDSRFARKNSQLPRSPGMGEGL